MTNDNVQNFPVVDKRIVDFTEKLTDFIFEHGQDLPFMLIVGSLETIKTTLIYDMLKIDV